MATVHVHENSSVIKTNNEHFPLLDLPAELLYAVIARVPAADRWRGAGSASRRLNAFVRRHFGARPTQLLRSCTVAFGAHTVVDGLITAHDGRQYTLRQLPGVVGGDAAEYFGGLPAFLRVTLLRVDWRPDCAAAPDVVKTFLRRAGEMTVVGGLRDQFMPHDSPTRPLPPILELFGDWEPAAPTWTVDSMLLTADNRICETVELQYYGLRIVDEHLADCAAAAAGWFHRPTPVTADGAATWTDHVTRYVTLEFVRTTGFTDAIEKHFIRLFKADDTRRTYFLYVSRPSTEPVSPPTYRQLLNRRTGEKLVLQVSEAGWHVARTPADDNDYNYEDDE